MKTVQAYPHSMEQVKKCSFRLRNSMVPEYSVLFDKNFISRCYNGGQLNALSSLVLNGNIHYFAENQTKQYRTRMITRTDGTAEIDVETEYMSEQRDLNGLKCFYANVAKNLINNCKTCLNAKDIIETVQKYLYKNYSYKSTGSKDDYSAVAFLKNGTGVCQAVSCVAAIILPFMGIPCLLVRGLGFSGKKWGPHMWNAIKIEKNKWEFVDFTFGAAEKQLVSTIEKKSEAKFFNTHRFTESAYSREKLEKSWSLLEKMYSSVLSLELNSETFNIDDETYSIDEGLKMLWKTGSGYYGIDLKNIVNVMGGAIEYIKKNDTLKIYLLDRQITVKNASRYALKERGFDVTILTKANLSYAVSEKGLLLQL